MVLVKYCMPACRELDKVLSLDCMFDDEIVPVYDMVSQGDDGFPAMTTRDGKPRSVKGKCFIIR